MQAGKLQSGARNGLDRHSADAVLTVAISGFSHFMQTKAHGSGAGMSVGSRYWGDRGELACASPEVGGGAQSPVDAEAQTGGDDGNVISGVLGPLLNIAQSQKLTA
jgi:hypothetical protein